MMNKAMLENVVASIDFISGRVVRGWNAKDDRERNFELSQANKMLEELSLSIRCEITHEEEIQAKIRLAKKEMAK